MIRSTEKSNDLIYQYHLPLLVWLEGEKQGQIRKEGTPKQRARTDNVSLGFGKWVFLSTSV
jgi:hypothetical protein